MQHSKIIDILKTSNREDWLQNDSEGVYLYAEDVNLRIIRDDHESSSSHDSFDEPWATGHPTSITLDRNAKKLTFKVFYNNSFIKERVLVVVDGGRAILPMPVINTNTIDKSDYKFASFVATDIEELNNYINSSKLSISTI